MSRCGQCKFYGVLYKPREVKEGIHIFGFCFKDLHEEYGSAYPIYVPDGGTCRAFKPKKAEKDNYEYEMTQEFKCECCKKELLGKIQKCFKCI